MEFRHEVEQFLKRTGMAPTVFGRAVAKDPRLVLDMRMGREVGKRLATKVKAWMEAHNR